MTKTPHTKREETKWRSTMPNANECPPLCIPVVLYAQKKRNTPKERRDRWKTLLPLCPLPLGVVLISSRALLLPFFPSVVPRFL